MDKFLGVGLKNAVGLTFFIIIMILMFKVVLNKHPVTGATELVNAI